MLRFRTQVEVCHLFNNKYPNIEPVTQSTVTKNGEIFKWKSPYNGSYSSQRRCKIKCSASFSRKLHVSTCQIAGNNEIVQNFIMKNDLVQKLNEEDSY